MPLFRALAKNMAPMTNADQSIEIIKEFFYNLYGPITNESPYAFSYLPVSLYSIYSLISLTCSVYMLYVKYCVSFCLMK